MYRILIADDEPIERLVVRKFVDTHYEGILNPVMAENGRDAVDAYEKENCEIALLDIEMPGMDGLSAAARIRKQHPKAKIVFLTAFDEFDYAKRAISVRALEYLLKPVDDKELMLTLDEAVRLLDEEQETSQTAGKELVESRESGSAVDADPGNDVAEASAPEGVPGGDGMDQGKLSAIRHRITVYLDENYMHDLALSDVAQTLHYSDAYFCKIFKQCFGVSFVMYLADLRVKKAKEMLEDISINIKEISGLVGYQDPNYFTKVFKRMENVTPSEYRTKVLGSGV